MRLEVFLLKFLSFDETDTSNGKPASHLTELHVSESESHLSGLALALTSP